ncbi:hypothetical protein HY798_04505 [Candidatus Falkowbacteria bacterium]|nr:hypothetical protein [Candidatus Falkowbacteria bacterium]
MRIQRMITCNKKFLCHSSMAKGGIGFILFFSLLVAIIFLPPAGYGKTKSYYSGDAISYNGEIVISSVNMGGAEIFKLAGGKITKTAEINSPEARYAGGGDFYEMVFNEEGGRLYAYMVDGRYLYKYDVTSSDSPALTAKTKDNSWDWFLNLDRVGGNIMTIGTRGLKIWNSEMEVINSYNAVNDYYRNIQISPSGNYLFNIDNDVLKIIDADSREEKTNIDLNINEKHNRKLLIDENEGAISVVDDRELAKYNFSGKLIKSFKHISNLGYDTDGLAGKDHFYFSDGVGVVKMDKEKLTPVKWIYTSSLGGGNGWAMRLKVVNLAGKEKIIVFNNSSIIALNDNLKMEAFFRATEKDEGPTEGLRLSVDKSRAPGGSLVSLRGGGFGQNENLEIDFAGEKTEAKADSKGEFTKVIETPRVDAGGYDIKVIGKNSGLSYNLGFYIE